MRVEACEEGYAGITVEIQDPNGRFRVGKSDQDGYVKVSGPKGAYSLYASDGWSYQSIVLQLKISLRVYCVV